MEKKQQSSKENDFLPAGSKVTKTVNKTNLVVT